MDLVTAENQSVSSQQKKLVASFSGEIYHGPLPDPEMLVRYKNADPSFPERIVKMAEKHNTADVGIKKSFSFSNTVIPIVGQVFTFLLGAGSLFTCIYLVEKGYASGAIAAIAAGFTPIIINALKGLGHNSRSREDNHPQQDNHTDD